MPNSLTDDLLEWYDEHKRSLPWRDVRTPYGTLISEVMLQQTRVDTVIPYYHAFMKRFPTVESLALAKQDDVLAMWSGLGYYSRARNLHKAAQQIVELGAFPKTLKEIRTLSGVGEYIAGAIASMAFDVNVGAVDGNLHRVLSRIHCDGGDRNRMWTVIEPLLPDGRCGDFNQALMDLGSSMCKKKPACSDCPIQLHCKAYAENRTTEFPVQKKKKSKKEEHYVALLIRSQIEDDTLCLAQRNSDALYGGMVEPCLVVHDTKQSLDANMWADHNLPVCLGFAAGNKWLDRGSFTHILTHKKLHIRVLECSISTELDIEDDLLSSALDAYKTIRWYSEVARESVGISTLATKVIEQSKNQQLSLF